MVDDRLEMLPAADTLHVFLRGERGMPGEDLETVEPAVLDHQEPSSVAKGVEAANGARRAFCDRVIHRRPFGKQSSVDRGVGQEAWTRALAEGDGQHPLGGVETESEVTGAGVAEPEMFTPPELPPSMVLQCFCIKALPRSGVGLDLQCRRRQCARHYIGNLKLGARIQDPEFGVKNRENGSLAANLNG